MPGGPRFLRSAIIFVIIFLSGTQALAAARAPRVNIEFEKFSPDQKQDSFIRSKIEFTSDGRIQKVKLADLSIPDAISGCPVDTMPADLSAMINELTTKVSSLISKIKDDQGDRCSALNNRLQATQNQIGTAYQYQLVAGNAFTNSASQDFINQQTQKAAAINQLMLTTSDILQNCISKDTLSDQQVIQKLIAQIITLSGLFMGGWQGLAIASGGQVLGALPLFTGDLDNAMRQFKYFNEMNERGSFLCYLRQIRKTSCLLFANEDDQFINGLDLSFQSGPVKTTIESVENYRTSDPILVEDLELLNRIKIASDGFMLSFEQIGVKDYPLNGTLRSPVLKTSLDLLESLCQVAQPLNDLRDPRVSLPTLTKHLTSFKNLCSPERDLSLLTPLQVSDAYWDLYAIKANYQNIVKDSSKEAGKVAQTLESLRYFEKLKKSFSQYSNSNAGNQMRMHFLDLSRKVSRSIGVSTFRKLFKDDYSKFIRTSNLIEDIKCNKAGICPDENDDVRSRALRAMIDLCMTLDPTLACQDVGDPRREHLFKSWVRHCVSPRSLLCKHSLARGERDLFLKDEKYRNYFDSLCGIQPQDTVIAANAANPPQPQPQPQSRVQHQ